MHWPELVKWPPLAHSGPGYTALPSVCPESGKLEYLANSTQDCHTQFYICLYNCFINAYLFNLVGSNIRAGTVIDFVQFPPLSVLKQCLAR